VHYGKRHRKNRTLPPSELQVIKTAYPFSLGRAFVADQGDRDLSVEDLITARIGKAQGEGWHSIEWRNDDNFAEDHSGGGPGEPGEHQARGDRHKHHPDQRLDSHDNVAIEGRRRHLSVANRRDGLDAEKEGVRKGSRPCICDRPVAEQIQEREQ
jgi:hypothetical protein